MDKDKALAALDAAFASRMEKLFGFLADGLTDEGEVRRAFVKGLGFALRAHAIASAEIERAFP